MRLLALAAITAVLAAQGTTQSAQTEAPNRAPAKPNQDTAGGDPMIDLYRSLADHYRMSERAIYAIRDRVGRDDLVAPVLLFTKRSSASPNQVMDELKAGKDWNALRQQWNVKDGQGDWVEFANTDFLANFHARTAEQVRTLRQKGLDWIAINQEFRRDGSGNTSAGEQRTRKSK